MLSIYDSCGNLWKSARDAHVITRSKDFNLVFLTHPFEPKTERKTTQECDILSLGKIKFLRAPDIIQKLSKNPLLPVISPFRNAGVCRITGFMECSRVDPPVHSYFFSSINWSDSSDKSEDGGIIQAQPAEVVGVSENGWVERNLIIGFV